MRRFCPTSRVGEGESGEGSEKKTLSPLSCPQCRKEKETYQPPERGPCTALAPEAAQRPQEGMHGVHSRRPDLSKGFPASTGGPEASRDHDCENAKGQRQVPHIPGTMEISGF